MSANESFEIIVWLALWRHYRDEIFYKIYPVIFAFFYRFLTPNPSEYILVVLLWCPR
jgi:hypothetical protein